MMDWYKHFIADWMDGTEDLDAETYRAYHVIVQLIYLNDGPILNNEKGIAGRSNLHLLTYRKCLKTLIEKKKLRLTKGRLHNNRAATELQSLANLRTTNADKGRRSGEVRRRSSAKTLENKDPARTAVQDDANDKRREEKRDKNPTPNGVGRGTRLPDDWKPKQADIDEAKNALGTNAGREFQKFKDYWRALPGQRGVKTDWDATWRNWVRKAQEMGNAKTTDNPRTGSLLAALDRIAEETDQGQDQDPILGLPPGPVRRS